MNGGKASVSRDARDGAGMPDHSPITAESDITAWCAAYLRRTLKLTDDPIDENAEFASLGLDSAESVFLVAAIEDWLGLELASDTAMEHPTLAQLARFVAGEIEAQSVAARARR
jgi:acyl carrier protein